MSDQLHAQAGRPMAPEGQPTRVHKIDQTLFARAADAYARAGALEAAAVNYSHAGEHDQAAEFYMRTQRYEDAAREYKLATQSDTAAWIYVHHLGDTDRARGVLDSLPPVAGSSDIEDENSERLRILHRARELSRDISSYYARDPRAALPMKSRHRAGKHELRRQYARVLTGFVHMLGSAEADWADPDFSRLDVLVARFTDRVSQSAADPELALAAIEFVRRVEVNERERERAADPQAAPAVALRRRLVMARCDLNLPTGTHRLPRLLDESKVLLADPGAARQVDRFRIEQWSVAIAELSRRYDQAALLFAAAVRGGQPGAADRWRGWTRRVLGAELVLDIPTGAPADG